jgi:DNA-binding transcriptional LysR family regulator
MAILVAVVKAGGFSAAARALGVRKQGLSDRVAALEAELGVLRGLALFWRSRASA